MNCDCMYLVDGECALDDDINHNRKIDETVCIQERD